MINSINECKIVNGKVLLAFPDGEMAGNMKAYRLYGDVDTFDQFSIEFYNKVGRLTGIYAVPNMATIKGDHDKAVELLLNYINVDIDKGFILISKED